MTFGILRANARPEWRKKQLTGGFVRYTSYFCEHKTRTAGFVFREEELSDFVKEHGHDPAATKDQVTPENWADDLADSIERDLVRVFSVEHEVPEGMIPENYDRFEVYARM
jgi:hypothetical protein